MKEDFQRLKLSEWAKTNLNEDHVKRLQELIDEAGGVNNISQARYLFELTRLTQGLDFDLARILSKKALESADDPAAWIEGDHNGLMSKYWGYQAFLETNAELQFRSEEESKLFFDVAERQVQLAPEIADLLSRHHAGPSRRHQHAGYFYLADRAATQGDFGRSIELVRRAKIEGWFGRWEQLEQKYLSRLS